MYSKTISYKGVAAKPARMRSPISALALVLGALVLAAAPGVNGDVYSDLEKWVVKNGGWVSAAGAARRTGQDPAGRT